MKDESRSNVDDNYRPIKCLPVLWKAVTGIIGDEMYRHMEDQAILPDEQKACKKNSCGTKDQLLMDKTILKNCKRRHTNLAAAWIDDRKAYDMIPNSWVTECLEMIGAASNTRPFVQKTMPLWRTKLIAGNQELEEVKI